MANTIKIKRGNIANLPAPSASKQGELKYALDTNELYIDTGSANALINPKSDWNSTAGTSQILNKPTFNEEQFESDSTNKVSLTNPEIYLTQEEYQSLYDQGKLDEDVYYNTPASLNLATPADFTLDVVLQNGNESTNDIILRSSDQNITMNGSQGYKDNGSGVLTGNPNRTLSAQDIQVMIDKLTSNGFKVSSASEDINSSQVRNISVANQINEGDPLSPGQIAIVL